MPTTSAMYSKRNLVFPLPNTELPENKKTESRKSKTIMCNRYERGTGESVKDKKRKAGSRKNIAFNIQSIILSVLMAISLVTIIVMGLLLYHQRFKLALDKTAVDNTEATVEATVDRLNADLLDIRQIFNGANYNIQEFDISSQEFAKQFSLLMRRILIRFRVWRCMEKEI